MRTFQFSDAKSHKFWTIDVQGAGFTVTYGKVGAAGQTQTKAFPSADKAQAEADKLVKEKTGKGYVETTPAAAVSDADALEKAVRANPDDLAAWSAYADFLTEKGDPRGEFMRVQLALEDESLPKKQRDALKKQEAALLAAHDREWLGALDAGGGEPTPRGGRRSADNGLVRYRFARGWLTRVEFPELSVAQAREMARTPAAKMLRELVVEGVASEAPVGTADRYITTFYEPGPDVPEGIDPYDNPALHALCRCPHLGGVRVFQLGEGVAGPDGKEEQYFNCHQGGGLAYHLVKQMPNLEELYLFAHGVDAKKLFALPVPKLRVLQLYHSHSYPLDKLAANKSLTNLTHVLCHPHAVSDDGDDEDGKPGAYIRLKHLRAICRAAHLTKLKYLRLRQSDFGDEGAEEIVKSGVLKRLTGLDLAGGCIGDDGAYRLAECPDLKNLHHLDLSRNAMSSLGIDALEKTGVPVIAADQHSNTGPGEFGDLPEYLYEGDIE